MEIQHINIVDLIENNPITKLSKDYNVKILTKIKEIFTDFEQHLFLSSFYCYLNCEPFKDFVIDLDDVWKWIGFSQKVNAKRVLEKNFIINKDYKLSLCQPAKLSSQMKGGQNKEIFMLNINTFKKFCLKAGTTKADEIHDYYIKMEDIIQSVINEECIELKKQLEFQTQNIENEKELLVEKTLIDQFPLNTQCIYYGKIDNKSLGQAPRINNETLIKFGQSNNLSERIKCHKKNFNNFRLVAAFKVKNKIEIENAIKKHPLLKKQIRTLTIENPDFKEENYREILALDNNQFTIEKIDEYIRDIIKQYEYNIENYNLLVEKNNQLEDTIRLLENAVKEKNLLIEKFNNKIQKIEYDIAEDIKKKVNSNYTICKYGYYLYAFQYEPMRFICSITRQKDYNTLVNNLKNQYAGGEIVCRANCLYSVTEKNMTFILKENSISLGQNKFELSINNIKKILDVSVKLEEVLISESKDVDTLYNILSNKGKEELVLKQDPEEPLVRKAKRPIDQINKDTGEIIETYESIEAAGRGLGLTTGTAIGIALRENRVCKGFLWRYTGVSKEDQFSEQPVIKICCSTGEKMSFKTIADAAKDANISPPGLRMRIMAHVHVNNFHWIFDKGASHCLSTF